MRNDPGMIRDKSGKDPAKLPKGVIAVVPPNFEVGDRVKFDAEGKIAISSNSVSLRGRSLEGAVLVGAHHQDRADERSSPLGR